MSESPATHFLQDLAIILSLAALVTVLFQRLKLPVVAGYLVAGVAVGASGPLRLEGRDVAEVLVFDMAP